MNDSGTFQGLDDEERLQVNNMNFTDCGFSGAPLVYNNIVIGVTTIKKNYEHGRMVFYVPSQRILECFKSLNLPQSKIYDEYDIKSIENNVLSNYNIDYHQYRPNIEQLKQECRQIKNLNLSKKNITRINNVIYRLSEICENNSDFNSSLELIGLIFQDFNIKDNDEIVINDEKEKIQKYLGCIYSLIICNISNLEEREKNLNEAYMHMKYAREDMDRTFEKNRLKWNKKDINFLNGQYNSNLGAYMISSGKLKIELSKKDFNEAINIHKKALGFREERNRLLQEQKDSQNKELNDSKVSLGISYRNIATAYYYLEDYKSSIENLKKALIYIDLVLNTDQYLQTLDCITGSYERIFDRQNYSDYIDGTEDSLIESFREDCRYLKEIVISYKFDPKIKRVENAIKRIKKLAKLCEKDEKLKECFETIFGNEFIEKIKKLDDK